MKRQRPNAAAQRKSALWSDLAGWRPAAALALAVLIFYWIPLTDPKTSIQWDAVDTHYSPQKYFADHVREGVLPFWTPYVFSGFPFLADLQLGAWYPLNWPFFLAGITPNAIQLEIALHSFLACLGAYLLLVRLIPLRAAALIGSLMYGFSGYFADHSSHVGMFSAASLMPWLLLSFDIALERRTARFAVLGGLVGGSIILAGHFQNALYSFTALGLFAASQIIAQPRRWSRAAAALGGIVLLSVGLSAIQTLPGLELTRHSIRESNDFGQTRDRILRPASFLRVILPIGGDPSSEPAPKEGAPDANFYLYGGILLLPLTALGLRNRTLRVTALLLIVLPVWYMLGPDAGFYRLGALVPVFHKVRAPIHLWFVAAFGLAILSAAGAAWILERWQRPWVLVALPGLLMADLYYWNSFTNLRAYARNSFDELYGNKERLAQGSKGLPPPLTRYDAPDFLTVFGPLNHPLDLKLETTYGYNPLALSAYGQYRGVMSRNLKLRSGLNVSRYLDTKAAAIVPNPEVLPRAYFAREILKVRDAPDALRLLESLDPVKSTIVVDEVQPAADGVATITSSGEQEYRLHYRTTGPALLKLSVPNFPGWRATVDGKACKIVTADYALMGIVVPAGEKDLLVQFHSNYFGIGAAVSAGSAILALAILFLPIGKEKAKMAG